MPISLIGRVETISQRTWYFFLNEDRFFYILLVLHFFNQERRSSFCEVAIVTIQMRLSIILRFLIYSTWFRLTVLSCINKQNILEFSEDFLHEWNISYFKTDVWIRHFLCLCFIFNYLFIHMQSYTISDRVMQLLLCWILSIQLGKIKCNY